MEKSAQRGSEIRLFFLFLVFFVCLGGIVSRLVYIQAVDATKYDTLGLQQRLQEIELTPRRGLICDRDIQELAVSLDVEAVYTTPYLVKEPQKVSAQLAPILQMDQQTLYSKLTRKNGFVYLARKVDQEKADEIRKLKIEGIGFYDEGKRCYPFNSLASHLLGFAGMDNRGLAGLELFYNTELQGKTGLLVAEKDTSGKLIPGGVQKLYPPVEGDNIVLTIDKDVQHKAEIELQACVEQYQAKSGSIIAMNPKNGEIYALANWPSFDLSAFTTATAEAMRNRAVTDVYEPGSTVKVLIASAALDEQLFEPDSKLMLPSALKVADKVIEEAHPRPAGAYSFTDIVTHSYNVGAVLIGMKLGKERIYDYLSNFGLGQKTGIDFPGEAAGSLLPADRWSGTTIGNIPFGQGIAVTPLQLLEAVSVIANDGLTVRPHLLLRIDDPSGRTIKKIEEEGGRKVISAATAREMRYIMEKTVTEGTGGEAKIQDYRVAGKTGTAQKARADGHGYEPDKYVSSFVGFVPAQDPQLAIVIVIDEPQGTIYGGAVAAPVFKRVAEFSLQHLKIPPN